MPNGYWNHDNGQANLDRNNPDNRNDNCAGGSAVKGYELDNDLSQPPSIRPVSASLAWVWKILVSLTILSSRKRRSFNVAVSKWLEAFKR